MTDLRESVASKVDPSAFEGERRNDGIIGLRQNKALFLADLALRAVADAGPTDAMIEAGAVAWYRSHGMPFDVLGDNTKATARKAIRAAVAAAMKEMG